MTLRSDITRILRRHLVLFRSKIIGLLFESIARLTPNRQQLLCFSSDEIGDNALALFLYLASRLPATVSYCWLVGDPQRSRRILESESIALPWERVLIVHRSSSAARLARARSSVVFDTAGEYYASRAVRNYPIFVSLWHGNPIKKIGASVNNSWWMPADPDYLCTSAVRFVPYFVAGLRLKRTEVLVTGLPRNDWLTGNLTSFRQLPEIPRPFVLWMPTYARSVGHNDNPDSYTGTDAPIGTDSLGCVTFDDLKSLESEMAATGCHLVIKFHPYDERNQMSFPALSSVTFLSADDPRLLGSGTYSLLSDSSALITDKSSVLIDYLLTGRPTAVDTVAYDLFQREDYFDLRTVCESTFKIDSPTTLIDFLTAVASIPIRARSGGHSDLNDVTEGPFCRHVVDALVTRHPELVWLASAAPSSPKDSTVQIRSKARDNRTSE
ncbi:MAG: hypothetical protein EG825_02560 [Rhodocyclaceae bacterium]|nr:hypothetical protein [Rhodocyclaceae bacterium]